MEMKYNLTMQEAEDYVTVMRQIFDMVRMISLEGLFSDGFQGDADGCKCYSFWKKEKRCENCIARKAAMQRKMKVKLEYVDDSLYQVYARYVEIDHEPYVMEMIKQLDMDSLIDPQGGEKQLIEAITGREVPSGGLPIDVGAVVQNVGTAFAVYEAVQKNKPLIERIVTVTGRCLARPSNLRVRIGTPIASLIEYCGGFPEDAGKVVGGGPMMGRAIANLDAPVTKGTSGILLIREKGAVRKMPQRCIKCAKCVSICTMGLEPYLMSKLAKMGRFDELEAAHVTDCIECGSCSYTCPAMLPLLDYIRLGKTEVAKRVRARKTQEKK